jgi:DNA phosphorothioation-associated putative methyltransferase
MAKSVKKSRLKMGKQVGGSLYVHQIAIDLLPARLRKSVRQAVGISDLDQPGFNVVKIEGDPAVRVSLLSYQSFDAKPFPALLKSCSVDLKAKTFSTRDYTRSNNPPILHRKELLLPPKDPRRPAFEELTNALEQKGLFADSRRIGFRNTWNKRLSEAGVEVRDHQVHELTTSDTTTPVSTVERHRTAMARQNLSVPMQLLAQHGFLDDDRRIFDYGCGRGDDLGVLTAAGLNACGWDPHFAPDANLETSATVNLGFVLNVIEDVKERRQALLKAFKLSSEVMAISVMLVGKGETSTLRPYRDGYLTSRDTFQKYFEQEEAQAFIQETLHEQPIPVAPGIFFVFADKISEQRFLERRHRRKRDISHLLSLCPPREADTSEKSHALIDENRDLIDAIWRSTLEFGRLPQADELPEDVTSAVMEQIGSIRKAIQLAQQTHDPASLIEARDARIEDLTIYYALNQFSQRQKYRELPSEQQRDIKVFFGTHARAENAGREVLFSLRDKTQVRAACQAASESGIGHLFGDHSLQLHAELIDQLPAILRIFIGCAEQLYGSIGVMSADLIKIHMQSSKLTLLRYDDFANSPLPPLVERIKIDLSRTVVQHFDYETPQSRPVLISKTRYLSPSAPGYLAQLAFDEEMAKHLPASANGSDAPMELAMVAVANSELASDIMLRDSTQH